MATNQTPFYKLNQWEAQDAVLRVDFNADNQKLDSALHALEVGKADGAALTALSNTVTQNAEKESADISALRSENCWVKLSDVTLTSGVTAYDWNLPDTTGYAALLCQFTLQGAGEITAKINGGVNLFKPSSFTIITEFELVRESKKGAWGQLQFFPLGFAQNVAFTYHTVALRGDGACSRLNNESATQTLTYANLRQINLTPESDSIQAGSRFMVYGLRQ